MRRSGLHPCFPGQVILASCLLLFSLCSCGKKGPLTVASYEKPEAPSLLAARHIENKIILSWSYPDDKEKQIKGFLVMKSSGEGFERLGETEAGVRSMDDSAIAVGTRYRYRVFARNLRGILSEASHTATRVPGQAPLPPRKISARPDGDSLYLAWEDSGKGELFNVYRSFEQGVYSRTPLNTAPFTATGFHDRLFPDRPVYYTVRALSAELDEGPESTEITADPDDFIPTAPGVLRCVAGDDRVYLYWDGPVDPWVRGFRVYRRFEGEGFEFAGETQIPSFLDIGKPARKRDYRVTALGPSREGPAAELKGTCGRMQ